MKAADIMTREVISVSPETPVRDAAGIMVAHRISGLPVIDKARHVVGIVTEGDFLRRSEIGTERRRSWWLDLLANEDERAAEIVKSRGLKVGDVMTRAVISVTPRTPLRDIVDTMEKWRIKRVPVVSKGELVGIVSRQDLLKAVSRAPARPSRAAHGDAAIREYLRRQSESETWISAASVNFVIENGKVELFGVVPSEAQREALRVIAESAPGVRSVKNNIAVMSLTHAM